MKKDVVIDGAGHTIPVEVEEIDGEHIITVDSVVWVRTENYMHAAVLFNLIADHITEYMNYEHID